MRPILFLSLSAFFVLPANTFAEEIPSAPDVQDHLNFVWTLMAAFLVFFMQAGFAMVEVGFTRAKNASNIIMKNLMDFCIGALAFWAVGFGIMFGASRTGWLGTDGFFFSESAEDEYNGLDFSDHAVPHGILSVGDLVRGVYVVR